MIRLEKLFNDILLQLKEESKKYKRLKKYVNIHLKLGKSLFYQ